MQSMKHLAIAAVFSAACGAADRDVDIEALTARDLLGLAPAVAADWDVEQRQLARDLLASAGAEASIEAAPLGIAADPGAAVLGSVNDIDFRRARDGRDVIPYASASVRAGELELVPLADTESAAELELVTTGWTAELATLLERDRDHVAGLAIAAGHPVGARLFVAPALREPVAALYLPERQQLLVNPILLASREPVASARSSLLAAAATSRPSTGATASGGGAAGGAEIAGPIATATPGNPYSFYGSIAECAAAERLRCESCMGSATCEPSSRDASDGNAECETLAADDGRGYSLFCANLAAAMATVVVCIEETAPGCPLNTEAGNLLSSLEANATLIDDPVCLEATDNCLRDIFGAPPAPSDPPRSTDVDCTSSANCDFAPQFGCSSEACTASPSCGSCDGGCEGGGCQGGCGNDESCDSSCDNGSCEGGGCDSSGCSGCDDNGGCNAEGCDSSCGGDSGGSGGSSGCDSGCGGDSGSGGESSGCDSGCGGDSGGESSGCDSGCGGDSGGGGSGGCDSGCGGDGGGCSGGDCGGDCGSSGSGGGDCGNCNVTNRSRRRANPWAMALLWGLFPLVVIGGLHRRERRLARRRAAGGGKR